MDWVHRKEHLAALQVRDHTIRILQARIREQDGAASLIPHGYASELLALADSAYHGNGASAGRRKAESSPPIHDPQAYAALRRELALLEKRAARDGWGRPQGPLSTAVDRLKAG